MISTSGRPLASLQLAFEHHEVVHELLHADARRSRELLGRGVIHRCGGTAELVSAPGQRASLAQELGDRFRGRRIRTVHVIVSHAVDSALHHNRFTTDRARTSVP